MNSAIAHSRRTTSPGISHLFYNDYTRLAGVGPLGAPFFDPSIPAVLIPIELENNRAGDTYGAELSASYRLNPDWEISGAYTLLQMDILTGEQTSDRRSQPNQSSLRPLGLESSE